MDATLIMTVEDMQDREKWLEARKKGIGGSEISAILGINPNKSAFEIWQNKLGMVEDDDLSDVMRIRCGVKLEPVVAEFFEEETGKKVRKCGLLQNKTYPWLLASVDRLVVGEEAGLECKTTAGWLADNWEDDKLPDSYYLQCQWYMACTGFKKWYIACLIGGNNFVWKEVDRNDADIAVMLEAAKKFWEENVTAKALPTVDNTTSCAKAIKSIYPGGDDTEVEELSGEWQAMCDEIASMEKDIKTLELEIQLRKNKLLVQLGNSEKAHVYGYNISLKNRTMSRVDTKKLKEQYAAVYQSCLKETTTRVLSIRKAKGEQ